MHIRCVSENHRLGEATYRGVYALTKKPLGVPIEIAKYLAADIFGLELAFAKTAGHDAIRHTSASPERVQIKGRAVSGLRNAGRISRI